MPHRVIILAGHRRSLSTVALTWALSRLPSSEVEVAGVVCVSEYSWRRIQQWRRRFGSQLAGRVISELGLSRESRFDEERDVYLQYLESRGVSHRNVASLCGDLGIDCRIVRDVNDASCLDYVRGVAPDYAIYSGAGILRQPLIDSVKHGILNLHCGPLPHVRGMNAVEWSLFLGLCPEVTLHFIDSGIDTGDILGSRTAAVSWGEPLGRLRARVVTEGIDLLTETLPRIDEYTRRSNPKTSGRQYYRMAEPLKAVVQDWINQGRTPIMEAKDAQPDDLRNALHRRLGSAA